MVFISCRERETEITSEGAANGKKGSRTGRSKERFNGCLCRKTAWIEVQVGIMLAADGLGWHQGVCV